MRPLSSRKPGEQTSIAIRLLFQHAISQNEKRDVVLEFRRLPLTNSHIIMFLSCLLACSMCLVECQGPLVLQATGGLGHGTIGGRFAFLPLALLRSHLDDIGPTAFARVLIDYFHATLQAILASFRSTSKTASPSPTRQTTSRRSVEAELKFK